MKIFGIGFHKTGTSSLAEALRSLGFSVTGSTGVRDRNIATNVHRIVREVVPLYDAFEDNPWPIVYRELDSLYPGSKFILTLRNPEAWIESVVRHFAGRHTPMREWIYGFGDPEGHEEAYLARYVKHNDEVMNYFSGRENRDFLVLRIAQGDGWEKLCPFLGLPVLEGKAFPHRNRSEGRKASDEKLRRTRHVLSRLGYLVRR